MTVVKIKDDSLNYVLSRVYLEYNQMVWIIAKLLDMKIESGTDRFDGHIERLREEAIDKSEVVADITLAVAELIGLRNVKYIQIGRDQCYTLAGDPIGGEDISGVYGGQQ